MRTLLDELEEDILVADDGGAIKFVSESLAKKLGYTQAEILVLNMDQILQVNWEKWRVKVYEENRVSLRVRTGDLLTYKVQVFRDDWCGEYVWYIVGEEVPRGEVSEDEARSILEQLPIMVATKELYGKYTYINKACRAYCEYSLEEVVGKTDIEIFGEDTGRILQSQDQQIIEQEEPQDVENWLKTKTGKMWLVNTRKSPLYDEQGEVCGVVEYVEQIMVNKWVESERARQVYQAFKIIETGKKDDQQTLNVEKRMIEDILKEIKAEGLTIWVYDALAEKLVCKFAAEFNKYVVQDGLGIALLDSAVDYKHKGCRYEWIKSLDEVDLRELDGESLRDKLRAEGVRCIGIFDMNYGGEFLGVVNFLYKQYDPADQEVIRGAKRTSAKLAEYIKRVRVSEELEKTMQKRMRTEAEFNELLSIVSDGIWVTDEAHKLMKVSRGIYEMLGLSEEVLLTGGMFTYVHEEDRSFVSYMRERCRVHPGEINRFVIRMKNSLGEWVWMECGGKYIADKQIYVWTGKNATQKYQFKQQQMIYEQQKQLQILKEEFLSNVSLELQEPIKSLLLDQQLLTQQLAICNGNKYMEYIKKNIYRLMRLVNNLIDSTHSGTDKYKFKKENCEVVGVIEDITRAAARYAVYKGIELYFETGIREQVIGCDVDKIERIMLNLISNAIKYTPRGGKIVVKVSGRGEQVILEVEDNGIGIPKEALEHIFEQFTQVDESLTRQNEGSGIGLSLAKLFVELHEGKIYAQSVLGKGSKITVELPAQKVEGVAVVANRGRSARHRMERCHIEFADIYDL